MNHALNKLVYFIAKGGGVSFALAERRLPAL